ncbi:MAG: hypothetical protein AAGL49_10410, partial [Pseudomonadota bacterium]
IAAATGQDDWTINSPASWPRLGTERMPWYPNVDVFRSDVFGEWASVMDAIAQRLSEFAGGRSTDL